MWPRNIRHFRPEEWATDPTKVDPALVRLLDAVREAATVPVLIHVAYDPTGHASRSLHATLPARAVDFHFAPDPAFSPLAQFALLSSFAAVGGLGFYPGWRPAPGWHLDLREAAPRTLWTRVNGVYAYGERALAAALSAVMLPTHPITPPTKEEPWTGF